MTDRPDVDLSQRHNHNFDQSRDIVHARDLRPRDVFEHPYSGQLGLVESVRSGERWCDHVVTYVPYDNIGGRVEDLTLPPNMPVQTFPPTATAHTNLGADLAARQVQAPIAPRPTVPGRT